MVREATQVSQGIHAQVETNQKMTEDKEQYVKIRKRDIDFIVDQLEQMKNEIKTKR